MSHARPRLGRYSLVLAIAMLVSAPSANATTAAYSGDNARSSSRRRSNAAHDIQFRLSADATPDEIIDTGFTSIPADCDVLWRTPGSAAPATAT